MRPPRDRGSASLLVLGVGLALLLLGVAWATVGTAVAARHQAQAAADSGALAGALVARFGESFACARAAELVAANGARQVACRLDGLDVIVTAVATPRGPAAELGSATAAARAGPVS